LNHKNIKGYCVIENFILLAKCWCGLLRTQGLSLSTLWKQTLSHPPPPAILTPTCPNSQRMRGIYPDPSKHAALLNLDTLLSQLIRTDL
jgi:hypothetical protein